MNTISKKDFIRGVFGFDKAIIEEQLKVLNLDEKEVVSLYFDETNRNNIEDFLLL